MDELAEAIGMDPVDLRLKNIPEVSQGRGFSFDTPASSKSAASPPTSPMPV